ncbi:MAG: recombinase [Clostridia bacterium]|nr:recombinase [Clostridia bacterium]
MLANGVLMKMIQDWLGHSDMGTTANIYSHLDSNSKIASAVTIGNALALSDEE